jgi:hypothetical protein
MTEHQIWIKKKYVCVGFYDRKSKSVNITFTYHELIKFLTDLGIKRKDIAYFKVR